MPETVDLKDDLENDPRIWDKFVIFANANDIGLKCEDDWMDWWECWFDDGVMFKKGT